ncbi:glycine zipper 2TM domain-containing protein (plasmid) [Comamonas aquatica]|nr:glycine zipper 2TM domain-containing protein [Comamonas aquatica]
MFRSLSKMIAVALLAITATGCAFNQHQQAGYGSVDLGVVISAKNASVATRNQEIGIAAIGGLLGGVLGNFASKNSDWRTNATAVSIGASVGGLAGNAIAKSAGTTAGQTVIVLNDKLQKMSITQTVINGEFLSAGDPVYIIRENGGYRASRMEPTDPLAAAFIAGLKSKKTN